MKSVWVSEGREHKRALLVPQSPGALAYAQMKRANYSKRKAALSTIASRHDRRFNRHWPTDYSSTRPRKHGVGWVHIMRHCLKWRTTGIMSKFTSRTPSMESVRRGQLLDVSSISILKSPSASCLTPSAVGLGTCTPEARSCSSTHVNTAARSVACDGTHTGEAGTQLKCAATVVCAPFVILHINTIKRCAGTAVYLKMY